VIVATVTATGFTDTNASPSTAYTYNVMAIDTSGNPSAESANLAVTTASPNGTGGGATSSSATLLDTEVFPNPSVGKDPTIRAFAGDADELDITIYDAAGSVVHTDRVTGGPTGTASDGRPYYDYVWTGKRASGVYYAVIHGKKGGAVVRGRVKFAVVK
jgi:chitodextrinase